MWGILNIELPPAEWLSPTPSLRQSLRQQEIPIRTILRLLTYSDLLHSFGARNPEMFGGNAPYAYQLHLLSESNQIKNTNLRKAALTV